MDHAKIADLQARMTALAAELAAFADEGTNPPASDPGVEITNLAAASERLAAPKPVPHTADDARAEIKRRFGTSEPAEVTDHQAGDDVEPPRDSSREAGAAEAARRFGKGH